jgi:hypothetical protein
VQAGDEREDRYRECCEWFHNSEQPLGGSEWLRAIRYQLLANRSLAIAAEASMGIRGYKYAA